MQDETTPQDSAAMSPASTGSVSEPVAWAVFNKNGELAWTAATRSAAVFGIEDDFVCEPLYRQAPDFAGKAPDFAGLTDAERKAIEGAIDCCEDITYGGAANQEAADVLKTLLERLK